MSFHVIHEPIMIQSFLPLRRRQQQQQQQQQHFHISYA